MSAEVECPPTPKSLMTGAEADALIATISGHLAIACDIEGFDDVAVATTNLEVEGIVEMCEKDRAKAKGIFNGTLKQIVKWRGQVDTLFDKGGVDWDNFCSDIVLYYCARAVLLGRPIPIISTIPKDACFRQKFKGHPRDLPKAIDLPAEEAFINNLRTFNPEIISSEIIE